MAWREVKLTSWPDQDVSCTVEVGGENIKLRLRVRWNFTYEFWYMDITDALTGEELVSGITLVCGDYPAADLLGQYRHLKIGSAVIVPTVEQPTTDSPTKDNLGSEFVLMWGDGDAV